MIEKFREIYTPYNEKKGKTKVKLKQLFIIFGGITMKETNAIVNVKETDTHIEKNTEWVIDGRTGMRMTKEEWIEMKRAERDY